ncbi:MAG TPA: TetR/AcrR family transcriptional regulator, partial [Colwellia sp.]|nr:TetR/AcrR family transcriptional regulator [Colwellia sp.]
QFLTSSQFFINNSDLAQDAKYRDAAFNLFWQSFAS